MSLTRVILRLEAYRSWHVEYLAGSMSGEITIDIARPSGGVYRWTYACYRWTYACYPLPGPGGEPLRQRGCPDRQQER
jgi:hypothetical protein